ncbi:hypothetical protein HAX54_006703 [Datura stramonium]|uniref:Uncharacterized protein n=1 Tax=Datura stramonium TaxID=4076 RepID=A0ABS8RUQ0_DATST|nr:hypothetical protein [Datura stramonium]
MADALKNGQEKTNRRRKLKRKIVIEDEVQLENVDPKEDEGGKSSDEELLVRVKRGKTVSETSSGKGTRLPKRFPTKKITSSSKRRPGKLIYENVLEKSVNPTKSKPTLQKASVAQTEGPGPMNVVYQENEELNAKVGNLT